MHIILEIVWQFQASNDNVKVSLLISLNQVFIMQPPENVYVEQTEALIHRELTISSVLISFVGGNMHTASPAWMNYNIMCSGGNKQTNPDSQ